MGNRAARWWVGGVLAATTGLVITVPPTLASDRPSASAFAAVRAAPSDDTGVTFEVVPASPTVTPPTPTPTATATPPPTRHPLTPTPSHGGELPVTGSGGSVLLLVALGLTLLAVGWLAARRRRPS
ncbi:LPXTG cell wall anchor domain-containing protein [Micromonospora lupini]|uniref:LPXTG cell wall anchor domain-containing protein n=1 Tax=Micromonospora lupini TaxID=285679 RepID=UPI002254EE42|nr:LPXTG cell wall anchor domain-containing protein [Micromonospora lupini]MCX5067999.1 LPXTG cell wall anchor domain-containing protein [Micromonospora lupini]